MEKSLSLLAVLLWQVLLPSLWLKLAINPNCHLDFRAQYADALSWVIVGTTLGMLLANVPVVLIGKLSADKMPLGLIRKVTAGLFLLMALATAFLSRNARISTVQRDYHPS